MHAMVLTAGAQGAPLLGAVTGQTGPSSFVVLAPRVVPEPAIPGAGPAAGMREPSAAMTSASTTPASSVGGVEPRASGDGCGRPIWTQPGKVQSCKFGGFGPGLLHPAPVAAITHAPPTAQLTSAKVVLGRGPPMAHASYSAQRRAQALAFGRTSYRSGRRDRPREPIMDRASRPTRGR